MWAEGLHNPKLVAPFYHGLVAPILELHRENLRLAAHEHPHRRSSGSRSFSSRRSCRGCSGKGCSRTRPRSTVKELYIAYLDIILPEK